jgi:hypothetical protein
MSEVELSSYLSRFVQREKSRPSVEQNEVIPITARPTPGLVFWSGIVADSWLNPPAGPLLAGHDSMEVSCSRCTIFPPVAG